MALDWCDIRDPNSAELDELAVRFQLHPLHVEDCRHRNQNAKVEAQGGYLFVVLKTVQADEEGGGTGEKLALEIGPQAVAEDGNAKLVGDLA